MASLGGSDLVKKVRQVHDWTQQRLADELGKPVRTIGRWERGEYEPRLKDARRLEALLERRPRKRRGA